MKIPAVTAGAFSIARYKLKIDLFLDLNRQLFELVDSLPPQLWKGYRLVAGDGTTVNLTVSESTINHFGLFRESAHGGKTVMANACMLYDVMSNFALAACISPFCDGEKTLMARLLNATPMANTIVLMDRGFCSFSFFKILIGNNLGYCIRLRSSNVLFAQKVLDDPGVDFVTDWAQAKKNALHAARKGFAKVLSR